MDAIAITGVADMGTSTAVSHRLAIIVKRRKRLRKGN
jgi:hypothetical protein